MRALSRARTKRRIAASAQTRRPAAFGFAEQFAQGKRYPIVVHVTAETLAGDADTGAELEGGQRLAPETTCRIACDGSLLRISEAADGNP